MKTKINKRQWVNVLFALHSSLFVCAALFSCSNEDYLGGHVDTSGVGVKINVTASITDYDDADRKWQEGDAIAITTGYGSSDVTARNREYVCGEDGVTFTNESQSPLYIKGATDILAYYPYAGIDGAEPTITLNTKNQNEVTEYFFAKKTGVNRDNGSNVELAFSNALSRVDMVITAPEDETIIGYRLSGFAQVANVDPYTFGMELNAPEDLTGRGVDITSLSLQLIPQTIDEEAGVPAQLVLIGVFRSYTIDMSKIQLVAGQKQLVKIDVTDGIGTVEFVPGGTQWNDSGLGGNVSAN